MISNGKLLLRIPKCHFERVLCLRIGVAIGLRPAPAILLVFGVLEIELEGGVDVEEGIAVGKVVLFDGEVESLRFLLIVLFLKADGDVTPFIVVVGIDEFVTPFNKIMVI